MNTTVLVSSCDKYKATWYPMAHSLKKYWLDCPYPISFITNHLDAPMGETIKVGDRHNWTEATRYALEQVKTDLIIWLLDDYWLTASTKTKEIENICNLVLEQRLSHVRLIPSVDANNFYLPYMKLAFFDDGAQYKTSLNAGIWNRKHLLELLKDNEFIWDFETQATVRANELKKHIFMAVDYFDYIYYVMPDNPDGLWKHHAVDRGMWTDSAKLYAQKENLNIDFSINPKDVLI